METSLISLEDLGKVAVVNFKPRESLYAADSKAMIEMWDAFDRLKIQDKRVIIFHMPKDYTAPRLVDDFWQRASKAPIDHAPARGRAKPQMVAAMDASTKRTLNFLVSLQSVTIGCCEGEVDFDLLGLLLACKHRMCSTDTTFVTVVVPKPIVQRPINMAVRSTDGDWLRFLDRWLDFERLDGSPERLRSYWVEGGGTQKRPPRWCVLRDVLHWIP